MSIQEDWFKTWFNSPYYHILYKNRNADEANTFIGKLMAHLKPPPGARMLDLACGKGRHAIQLASYGYAVTGIDLSEQNIAEAKKNASDTVTFLVHDMRKTVKPSYFDYIFNFFTSFGYFERKAHNEAVMNAIRESLVPKGRVIIDFLNVRKAVRTLIPKEHLTVDGISFEISRKYEKGVLYKQIEIEDQGQFYRFEEQLQAFLLDDFQDFFIRNGLTIQQFFGDYRLNDFDPDRSDRLIILGEKP